MNRICKIYDFFIPAGIEPENLNAVNDFFTELKSKCKIVNLKFTILSNSLSIQYKNI